MSQPAIQTSFASGEWAPKLRSRVDVQKYRTGAAYLRNFYVDYSGGGASTRQGTRFINQCKAAGARLIPFQPSSTLSYVLEFGQNYIRFYSNGAPVLETAVTGGSAASGDGFTIANSYNVGDWVYATGWGGLTNVNGRYFIVASGTDSTDVIVTDLNGNSVTFAGTYTSGGQLQRVYTIATPYNASDLFPNQSTQNPGLKWVQDVTSLIICHPTYAPAILTINAAASWTFVLINFGPTVAFPTNVSSSTTLSSGSWNYSYLVTAVDASGQESAPSTPTAIASVDLIDTTPGTNTITWTAVPGAQSYNVYKASPAFGAAVVAGAQYGFIGNVTGTSFQESYPSIGADFSQTPPILQNPFFGASVASLALTANANYTSVPTVTIAAPSSGGVQATAFASLAAYIVSLGNSAYLWNQTNTMGTSPVGVNLYLPDGVVLQVTSSTFLGAGYWSVGGVELVLGGAINTGSTPSNPVSMTSADFPWVVGSSEPTVPDFNLTWHIGSLNLVQGGEGYTTTPLVTISGSATGTATLGTASGGNPGVPGFLQERLWLAGQPQALQTVNISQPTSFFNFNTSNPSEDDDGISASIISEELNDVRSLLPVPTGMIAFTGKGAWLLNGGGGISTMNPITPSNITAQPQAFNGANDLRPIKINFDALYCTNKGNYVRDLTYNLYAQIFTGADITTFSNHLFFGFSLVDWCWAEEPFKTLWAIRNDGTMLSLGYVKDQELIGWAHHDTNGQFTSCCSVYELVNTVCVVDAVYVIVQRLISGNLVSYVERMADRYFPYGYEDSWSVDCALQTQPQVTQSTTLTFTGAANAVGNSITLTDSVGAPFTSTMATNNWVVRGGGGIYEITSYTSASQVTATVVQVPSLINLYTNIPYNLTMGYTIWEPVTTVTGLTQLIGQTVTGTADGAVVSGTVLASGSVTLANAASKITLGLAMLPQLQTLPLDLGEPTVQGKRKKISAVTVRVADTLGLQIGTSFANATTMKDFQLGNVGTQSNAIVTGLVNGDGRTIMDQEWQEAGNYCLQQNLPYPATILGVMPEVTVGDTPK